MSRLAPDDLAEMRQFAKRGYAPYWGGIDQEREADPEITLKRSEIAEYQHALLRALEEVERCYERLPPA